MGFRRRWLFGCALAAGAVSPVQAQLHGLNVVETGGTTEVSEPAGVDHYFVSLRSQPTADVVVALRSREDEVTIAPTTLTFKPEDFDRPQKVTVAIADDARVEGAHVDVIEHYVMSNDRAYLVDPTKAVLVTVAVTDNDVPEVVILESGGTTRLVEGRTADDSYAVVLRAAPNGSVSITLTPDAQLRVAPTTLVFTSRNYNTPQAVQLKAEDDTAAEWFPEGFHTGNVVHTVDAATPDDPYKGVMARDLVASITDNDSPSLIVLESNGSTQVVEGGASDTYQVALSQRPVNTVVVDMKVSPGLTVSPSTVRFTAGNFSSLQTVTVTAVDDQTAGGPRSETIAHKLRSDDVNYDAIEVPDIGVLLADNDITSAPVPTTDGGTLAWTMLLPALALAGLRRRRIVAGS